MPQMSVQPREPLLAYIEANPLVYWMLPNLHNPGSRTRQFHRLCHQEAQNLISLFSRYTTPAERIIVVTSRWALVEAHSVLYKDAMWENNAVPTQHRNNTRFDPRKIFPPHGPSLQQATELLDRKIGELSRTVALRIDEPNTEIWATALRISEECGIYAPDCLHLATALHSGCNVLVTQDIDFLNSTHYFQQSGVIGQILQDLFAPVTPPSFEACPLRNSGRLQRATPTARRYLAQLGYT